MKNLLTAWAAVMADAGYVQKDGKNEFHGYKYASEAALLSVVRQAMIKHGLLLIGPTVEGDARTDEHGNTYVTLAWTIAHTSGEVWPTPLRIVGCGNDKSSKGVVGDKGIYKAYTGAEKYLLMKALMIATGDDPEAVAAHDYAAGQLEAKPPAPWKMGEAEQRRLRAVMKANNCTPEALQALMLKYSMGLTGDAEKPVSTKLLVESYYLALVEDLIPNHETELAEGQAA